MTGDRVIINSRGGEVRALLERGARFIEKGKPANALRAFEDAIRLDPACAEAFCHRGNALADLGHIFPAIASYDRAIALNPRLVKAHDFKNAGSPVLAGRISETGSITSVDVMALRRCRRGEGAYPVEKNNQRQNKQIIALRNCNSCGVAPTRPLRHCSRAASRRICSIGWTR